MSDSQDKTTDWAAFVEGVRLAEEAQNAEIRRERETPPTMDMREHHIRALALLMTRGGWPSTTVLEYLHHHEFGLALQALAAEIQDEGR